MSYFYRIFLLLTYPFTQFFYVLNLGGRKFLKYVLSSSILFTFISPLIELFFKKLPINLLVKFVQSSSSFGIFRNLCNTIICRRIGYSNFEGFLRDQIDKNPHDQNLVYNLSTIELINSGTYLIYYFLNQLATDTTIDASVLIDRTNLIASILHENGLFSSAEKYELYGKYLVDRKYRRPPGNYFESTYATAIGHISLIDYVIKGRLLGILSQKNFSILYNEFTISNSKYFEIIKSSANHANIVFDDHNDNVLVEPNMEIFHLSSNEYQISRKLYGLIQNKWLESNERTNSNLKVDSETIWKARRFLSKKGVDITKKFVGVHVRNSTDFLKDSRNSNIEKMISALRYLGDNNFNVFHISSGEIVADKIMDIPGYYYLNQNSISKDIFESLCIYIWSSAEFFVGNLSGGTMPPATFGIKTLWFDVFPIAHIRLSGPHDYVIPKQIHSFKLDRNLTFTELMNPEFFGSQSENPYFLAENGYRLIENDETDILNGVKSMITEPEINMGGELLVKNQAISEIYKFYGFNFGAKIEPNFLLKIEI